MILLTLSELLSVAELTLGFGFTVGDYGLLEAALAPFHGLNGRRRTLTNDAAYGLVMQVAAGQLDLVGDITAVLSCCAG